VEQSEVKGRKGLVERSEVKGRTGLVECAEVWAGRHWVLQQQQQGLVVELRAEEMLTS